MNNGNICVSIGAATADAMSARVRQAEPLADIIELRFDYLDPLQIDKFLRKVPRIKKKYLITYRPQAEGGHRPINSAERKLFWAKIHTTLADTDFLVDYESDLVLPENFNPARAVVSRHYFAEPPASPQAVFDELSLTPARIVKIAVQADQITDALALWHTLDHAKKSGKPMIPVAMGEAGKWSRILGPAHGAFMTYAAPEYGGETAAGQISVREMNEVYRVKELNRDTAVYGVVAGDTSYSMSPFIHNAAFRARAIDAVFIPLQVADLESFIRRMVDPRTREVNLNFKGFAVTNPHKQTIINHLSRIDPDAAAIGAVNTVSFAGSELRGYNTDAEGFIAPLLKVFGDLKSSRAAVIGTGGAARSCVYALKRQASEVTIFGRDIQKAESLAVEAGSAARPLDGSDFGDFDILVNATPAGTKGTRENETVAVASQLARTKLVYDLIYNPRETRLAREAKAAGAAFIGGLEMLINQGAKQFEIWTGSEAPVAEMRAAAAVRLQSQEQVCYS